METSLIKQQKGLYALANVYLAAATDPTIRLSKADPGYHELVVDKNGQTIRKLDRKSGSDIIELSEKDKSGVWTTFPIACPVIAGREEVFSDVINACS